ncbi:hypothetical protein [Streptomyces sp. NPDC059209]|uniref:hypothetical protein n=1 Tax=Streptomyces sp. NPDC059209 TaxID=3346769 RepID=UPI0036A688AA
MVRIDALGVHQIGLYKLDEALRTLIEWLPRGPSADGDRPVDADAVLSGSERSALVTVTEYTAVGSAETAGASTDLILARNEGRLHVLSRDPGQRERLVAAPEGDRDGVRDRLADLLAA